LDVVAQDLAVTLRAALSEALTTLAAYESLLAHLLML
jgi:hypothetical protein